MPSIRTLLRRVALASAVPDFFDNAGNYIKDKAKEKVGDILGGIVDIGIRVEGGLDMSRWATLRPKYDTCELALHMAVQDGDTLWIHGGVTGYDNGTRTLGPNHVLRRIDFSQSFALADREVAPVTYIEAPTTVPEASGGSLILYKGKLLELPGENVLHVGKSYPLVPDAIQTYDIQQNSWSSMPIALQSGTQLTNFNITGRHYGMAIPKLGKAYVFGGHHLGSPSDKDPMRRSLVYNLAQNTWTPLQREFRVLFAGTTVHLPIGPRGIMVLIGGRRERAGQTMEASTMANVDIFNLNAVDANNPEGTWYQHIATAANPKDGTPLARFNTCAWVAYAPDGSSAHIYVYAGQEVAASGQDYYQDLWVLSLPSFEWILIDKGEGLQAPRFNQTRPGQREGHSCHLMRKSMAIMVGGRIQPENSRACETTALYAYDLNVQQWVETYDVDKADEEYKVPKAIYDAVGGNEEGGASRASINAVSDPVLQPLIEEMRLKGVRKTASSTSGREPENTSDSKPMSKGTIAGIAFGVVVGVPLLCAIVYFIYQRLRSDDKNISGFKNPNDMEKLRFGAPSPGQQDESYIQEVDSKVIDRPLPHPPSPVEIDSYTHAEAAEGPRLYELPVHGSEMPKWEKHEYTSRSNSATYPSRSRTSASTLSRTNNTM